ncbi:MAG: hypothetical protein H0V87_01945, partial [Chloroflexi bacterium]|nr:hypothetical protein [Chloroflexota bacterium]
MIEEPTLPLGEDPDPRGETGTGTSAASARMVEVAVDAVGRGGARTWTYAVPAALEPVEPGEAVLVPYGRRQALGVVLGGGAPAAGVVARPLADRVRADGPLLPPLALELARWIAGHY